MLADIIKYKGYRCFKDSFVGFDEIKPINIIIGRNNSGKSHLLDLVANMCTKFEGSSGLAIQCEGMLNQVDLKSVFQQGTSGGGLDGDHWGDHGRLFVNKAVKWRMAGDPPIPEITELETGEDRFSQYRDTAARRKEKIKGCLLATVSHLNGYAMRRLRAERDVGVEGEDKDLKLLDNGEGATNIIRRFLNSADDDLDRNVIQTDLLDALNDVFFPDEKFEGILTQQHDYREGAAPGAEWEVFLVHQHRKRIPLSRSGSGLKTVILVLLNLLVIPKIQKQRPSEMVFAFEELENNLHPAVLRRLLIYIEDFAVRENSRVFLTTHSSTALDVFGASENAQIVHVRNDGVSSHTQTVGTGRHQHQVLRELGLRPSDLLQANGIVWVEGPSDRLYLKKWIELFSDGKLIEGRHYQCVCYGGALLARNQFSYSENAVESLINLLKINPNIVVVCDSDRKGKSSQLKSRVKRVRGEVQMIDGAVMWVTDAREIENYLNGNVLSKVFSKPGLRDPAQYEDMLSSEKDSYLLTQIRRKSADKVQLAEAAVGHITFDDCRGRFDLEKIMKQIVGAVKKWNSIE